MQTLQRLNYTPRALNTSQYHQLNLSLDVAQSSDVKRAPIGYKNSNISAAQQQVTAQLGFCEASSDVHLLPCGNTNHSFE